MAAALEVICTIKGHKPSADTQVFFRRILDFTPWEGLTIRLTDEDRNTMDIELSDIVYENESRTFIVELEDNELYESLRDRPESVVLQARMAERVAYYKSFGWE